jgi:cysteine-rich repeat protein
LPSNAQLLEHDSCMGRTAWLVLAGVATSAACAEGVGSESLGGSASLGSFGQPTATAVDDTAADSDASGTPSEATDTAETGGSTDADDTASGGDSDDGGPPPGCGNAMVEGVEECDQGAGNGDTASCKSDCTDQVCGDGFVGPGEGCDDGNVLDADGCSNACVLASCGDGVTNTGEACDDGNTDDTDECPSTCQGASCGDGFIRAGVEECDAAGQSAQCDTDCTAAGCGDGTVNPSAGEACDDGNGNGDDACPPTCQNAFCGDGYLQAGVEQCDDGNGASGDGCSSSCANEFPNVCDAGNDPGTGSPWVVCAADASSAWISASTAGGGTYHPVLICQGLGYDNVGQYGGTCGNVCGFCGNPASCAAPGDASFSIGAWDGGNCGADGLGALACVTVMWTCV